MGDLVQANSPVAGFQSTVDRAIVLERFGELLNISTVFAEIQLYCRPYPRPLPSVPGFALYRTRPGRREVHRLRKGRAEEVQRRSPYSLLDKARLQQEQHIIDGDVMEGERK